MISRDSLINAIHRGLEQHEFILGAYLGGSDATGRADAKSDVDVFMLCRQGCLEQTVTAIESAIETVSPIRLRYRLPMPTWHGFHQAFYQLENVPEYLMVDWIVVEEGIPHPWLEVERHGTPRILFDRTGAFRSVHVDTKAIASAVTRKVTELRLKFPMFRHLPVKLVERGLMVDAAYFYQALVLRPLVDLLRCVHCPERHDYGFRYVRDDLPREDYEALQRLSYPTSPDDIICMTAEVSDRIESLLATWDATNGSTPSVPSLA